MTRPQFQIRWLAIAVAVVALFLTSAITAYRLICRAAEFERLAMHYDSLILLYCTIDRLQPVYP
jgi:hypothetical protein